MDAKKNHIIPDGWAETTIGKVITEQPKSKLQVGDAANFGNYPFFTSGVSVLLHNETIINGENIYLATGGNAIINYFDGNAAYSTDTYAIKSKQIETLYLYYLLLKNVDIINQNYFSGSGLKHLQKDAFKKHIITLPQSLPEQQQIAAVLSAADQAIAHTQALIDKYRNIKTGLLHDLLLRGIDAHGNIRSPQTHKFKNSPLGMIPEEWECVKLESMYKSPIRDFGSFSSTKLITFLKEGIPFIKSEIIEENYINWKSVSYISEDVHKLLSKSYVLKGNILFSKIGSALGKSVIFDGDEPCNSNAAVAKIDIDNSKALSEFINIYMNSFLAKAQFSYMIISLLPRINLQDINSLLVVKPSISEQQRIVETISHQDKYITELQTSLSKLRLQKAGLMEDLLSGKKRVTKLMNNKNAVQ